MPIPIPIPIPMPVDPAHMRHVKALWWPQVCGIHGDATLFDQVSDHVTAAMTIAGSFLFRDNIILNIVGIVQCGLASMVHHGGIGMALLHQEAHNVKTMARFAGAEQSSFAFIVDRIHVRDFALFREESNYI